MEDKHHVRLTLTDLEWEIVSKAWGASIRSYLVRELRGMGFEESEDEMMKAWDSVTEKWDETY